MANTESPVVPLSEARLPDLLRLSQSAHWNQAADDWRYMLIAGHGWGITNSEGSVVASTIVLPYDRFAWVSMVLALPEHRGQGHVGRLLRRAIESLRDAGHVVVLDATPAGYEVYRRYGFTAHWGFARWQQPVRADQPARSKQAARFDTPAREHGVGSDSIEVRAIRDADWPEVLSADLRTFGASREILLRSLSQRLPVAALVALCNGAIVGSLFGRPGREATQLGPLRAQSVDIALALLDVVLAQIEGPVFVDALDAQREFCDALSARGFCVQRPFTRMTIGGDPPGDLPGLMLVAGPELG